MVSCYGWSVTDKADVDPDELPLRVFLFRDLDIPVRPHLRPSRPAFIFNHIDWQPLTWAARPSDHVPSREVGVSNNIPPEYRTRPLPAPQTFIGPVRPDVPTNDTDAHDPDDAHDPASDDPVTEIDMRLAG